MYYIVDRFEGNFGVCEDYDTNKIVNIERSKMDTSITEGDIIFLKDGLFVIDKEKTQERKNYLYNKLKSIWK